uniref:Putative secreted protein n=1 Tax=Ixodes ricinus TaxID=34613 RepID=A0A6B0UEX8_IXORI
MGTRQLPASASIVVVRGPVACVAAFSPGWCWLARPIPAALTHCRDGVFCPGLVDCLNMLEQMARNTILALLGTFPRNVQSHVQVDHSRPGCAHRQFWFHF